MATSGRRASKRVKPEQLDLRIPKRGGSRKGAGRKPSGPRRRVAHAKRPETKSRHPLHVTLRVREGVPNLRKRSAWAVVVQAMRALMEQYAGMRGEGGGAPASGEPKKKGGRK